ncbi:MAG: GDSL-type esterase/lipase family protein [Candidatus Pacearchaeota archaeon]|jgi:lysophospholipase L1-like esterase
MAKTICVFGASTAYGKGDNEKGGWVNRLRLSLEKENNVIVYNFGIIGETTRELIERFTNDCYSRNPDIIIFAIGDNDSSYVDREGNNRVEIDEYELNIEELIKKAKEFTDKIVFVGLKKVDEERTMPLTWKKNIYFKNKNIIEYDERLRHVTKAEDIHYLSIFDSLELRDLSDGLHPDKNGHHKISVKVKDFLVRNKWVK